MAVAAAPTPDDGYFSFAVAPILQDRCVSCHGANKQKGKLRLDSFAALMQGGTSGAVVIAGETDSELIHRVTLPPSHDDFMPTGKAPLSDLQIATLRDWIEAGAPEMAAPPAELVHALQPSGLTANDDDAHEASSSHEELSHQELAHKELDPAVVAEQRAPLLSAVLDLQEQYPGLIEYESRSSADLILHASVMREKFDDAFFRQMAPLFDRIVVAELSRTAVTDASGALFQKMPRLKVLRLAQTDVSDAFLEDLATHESLSVLNLFGTAVSIDGLMALSNLSGLTKVYAAETPAAAAMEENDGLAPNLENILSL